MTDSPTYEIYLSVNNVGTSQINEGDTLKTMVWMKNGGFISRIHSGTPLFYSLSGIGVNSVDFVSGALIGTGELDDTGLMTFYHTLANDDFMEGDESLNIKIFSDSDRTIQVSDTTTILIKDILNNPTYTIDTSHLTIQEGETLTISISTTMVPTGTDLYFINSGEGITGSDFSIGTQTPFTTVDSTGNASLTQTILSDKTTEGNETLNIKLFSNSGRSIQIGDTKTVTIIDSSVNEEESNDSYALIVDSPSVIESDNNTKLLTYTLTLDQPATEDTNINYETLTTGTATSGEDFVKSIGGLAFLKGQKTATFNIIVYGDTLVESDETIQVKFSGAALSSEVIATGTIKNNDIAGTDSNDTLNGTTDNDNLKGGGGSDVIDGGAGTDTATYTGKFNDYTITKTTTTIQITDIRVTSPDGVDTIQNIEYVQFTDQLVASDKVNVVKTFSGNFMDYKFYNKGDGSYEIKSSSGSIDVITGIPKLTFADKTGDESVSAIADIKGVFDQVTGLNTGSGEMFRLYNAAFARFPDASGLQYWIDKYTSGVDDSRAVSQSFLASAEFKERYGDNISHETYVKNLYLNVLNRELDQSGYDYWVGNLNNGVEQRHEVLLGFAESAENKTLFTEMTGLG
jgi:hypothetical protein